VNDARVCLNEHPAFRGKSVRNKQKPQVMNSPRYALVATITAFSSWGALLSPMVGIAEAQQEQEVLTRGPVHEAFAASINFEPQAGILINSQPPEPIDELPPEQQLEGDNVTWISGYWAWDEDQDDFLWISGVWRNIPPDREWIPGYWNESGAQFQWVSGYWEDSSTTEVSYLPEPPKSVEVGPNVEAPSRNHSWIPGQWAWTDTRYRWSPGYWEPLRENWTYVPSYYNWTPRGYIYVDGYWDYAVARRGVIFAPVHFRGDYYRQPGFSYSPVTVISLALLVDHLFVRPSYGHYYYGDYYEPRYRTSGFYASFSYSSGYRGYDPIYAHQRWSHRNERDWERRRSDDFNYFRDNRDARPPRTWADLREMPNGGRGFKGRNADYLIAAPIEQFAKTEVAGTSFKKLDQPGRERIVAQRQEMRTFRQERQKLESGGGPLREKAEGAELKPAKVKAARSPIMGKKAAQLAKEEAPPPRRKAATAAGVEAPGKGKAPREGKVPSVKEGETMPERGPKVKPEREPKAQTEPKVKPQREPKAQTEPKVKPQREPKVQPEPKMKTEREPKVQPERKAQPQREPKVQPERKAQPQREPKVQPERKVQPQREPKVQPERKVQPQREPKVQPERKVQPQREPKVQPERKVQPQREPKEKPEREKKEKGAN
jgi:hypothetical protein